MDSMIKNIYHILLVRENGTVLGVNTIEGDIHIEMEYMSTYFRVDNVTNHAHKVMKAPSKFTAVL